MEWILSGVLIGALVLLYYTAKKNGKLEEQNRQKSSFLNAQAEDLRTLQAQMFRWDSWREKVDARLKGIDIRTIPDPELSKLYKDPTIIEITDPHSTKLGESSRPIGGKESKK